MPNEPFLVEKILRKLLLLMIESSGSLYSLGNFRRIRDVIIAEPEENCKHEHAAA